MIKTIVADNKTNLFSWRSIHVWRILQTLIWLIGLVIFLSLVFYPTVGLLVFWNILIPVAPALLTVATGVWRNVCPLAITNLLPRHFGLSQKRKMQPVLQAKLQLAAILLLYAIVPMRHLLFNTNGPATATLLFAMVVTGMAMGFVYDWKSGWCSSLCPVHPVEKLYGGNTLFTLPNAHCSQCVNCSVPCPDSTPNFHPALATKTIYQTFSAVLTIGGLPGFIWGWFHVPDLPGKIGLTDLFTIYAMPYSGFCVSLSAYLLLEKFTAKENKRILISCFAAAGVSCYYWYRIPALLGFGRFAEDTVLIDLRSTLPPWSILIFVMATTIFFFGWFLLRKPNRQSWVVRPEFAAKS